MTRGAVQDHLSRHHPLAYKYPPLDTRLLSSATSSAPPSSPGPAFASLLFISAELEPHPGPDAGDVACGGAGGPAAAGRAAPPLRRWLHGRGLLRRRPSFLQPAAAPATPAVVVRDKRMLPRQGSRRGDDGRRHRRGRRHLLALASVAGAAARARRQRPQDLLLPRGDQVRLLVACRSRAAMQWLAIVINTVT
jgi:hypothetical protein